MPRIDDYIAAKKLAVEKLAKLPLDSLLQQSGFTASEAAVINIPFLNRNYRVSYPDFDFVDACDTKKDVPIQEQVLILHYLSADSPRKSPPKWIAYREISGAAFYFSAFVKRAIDPLKTVFGQNVAGLKIAADRLDAVFIETGDAGFEFHIFPNIPLQMILWIGDDEFPAEANILFDQTIGEILSPEDVAWLAGMVVYRLIALSR
jgi:hypothetical protein